MCLCYLFSAKTAWQLVNRKADFFYKTNRFESIRITNRIDSNRELECSTINAVKLLVMNLCYELYCFLFLEFFDIQRRSAVLSVFSQPDFQSRSLALEACDNSSSLFSSFAQMRCISDSGRCHQEKSRYTAALNVVWLWTWWEQTRPCSKQKSSVLAHRLHSFLLQS